jgi:hypothetical protein
MGLAVFSQRDETSADKTSSDRTIGRVIEGAPFWRRTSPAQKDHPTIAAATQVGTKLVRMSSGSNHLSAAGASRIDRFQRRLTRASVSRTPAIASNSTPIALAIVISWPPAF